MKKEMLMLTALMCGMSMDKDIALIIDGRFSGLSRGRFDVYAEVTL